MSHSMYVLILGAGLLVNRDWKLLLIGLVEKTGTVHVLVDYMLVWASPAEITTVKEELSLVEIVRPSIFMNDSGRI
jgi:hypothetical protein